MTRTLEDRETRERLLTAAARLFAERGFSKVTVRDICEKAHANVAAVNYHFDGKIGLYEDVLRAAIRTMQGTTDAARKAGEHRPPAEQLEAYISIFLKRVTEGRDSWIHQLMLRELSDPTPALDMIIEQVLRPRMGYLAGVIAELLGADERDPRVHRCLMSVHAQIHAVFLENPVAERLRPDVVITPQTMTDIARHITCFSLAGIRAIATT